MTHREYLTLVEYYTEGKKERSNTGKKAESEKSKEPVTFGPPVFEPLTEVQKAKVLWAGRVGIKERVT